VEEALESSRSSDRAPRFVDRGRFRGHRGGVIAMHRALARFDLGPLDLITSALLVLLVTLVWIASLPWLCRFWRLALVVGTRMLALPTDLGLGAHQITPYVHFAVPYPRMDSIAPDARTWWFTAAIVIALWIATLIFPAKFIPITYLLRAVLFIQATALVYFLLFPARFPHTPDSYLEGFMSYAIGLISFVPILFGLTYYIFDFGLIRKAALTAMTMGHLSLFLPFQILLQAVILRKSVLFMPLLYIVFGLPLDIAIILAFYSWGMSWSFKTESKS
jgi:hypothetical protein